MSSSSSHYLWLRSMGAAAFFLLSIGAAKSFTLLARPSPSPYGMSSSRITRSHGRCSPVVNGWRTLPDVPDTISSSCQRNMLIAIRTPHAALSSSASASLPELVNGDSMNVTYLPTDEALPSSPPLSFQKFMTMQEKRVVVMVRYSGLDSLKPFFLTIAKKIKTLNPDIIMEQRMLPAIEDNEEIIFEILVDGKVVIGKGRSKKQSVRRSSSGGSPGHDLGGGLSVFISMEDINTAITKARKRRRPATMYAEKDLEGENGSGETTAVRLEMLRMNRETQDDEGP